MGFCTPEEHADFLCMVPLFEEQVVSQGIRLIKYFFDVSQDVQEQRFLARLKDPLRHWKLSPMDVESWRRWWDYTAAYAEMIERTDTDWAPWYRVQADVKRSGGSIASPVCFRRSLTRCFHSSHRSSANETNGPKGSPTT